MATDTPVAVSSQLIQLFTAYPCAGTNKADFGLTLPGELSDRSYEVIVKHIEFRRRCMHQGFDNLLELLALHKDGFDKMTKNETTEAAGEGCRQKEAVGPP